MALVFVCCACEREYRLFGGGGGVKVENKRGRFMVSAVWWDWEESSVWSLLICNDSIMQKVSTENLHIHRCQSTFLFWIQWKLKCSSVSMWTRRKEIIYFVAAWKMSKRAQHRTSRKYVLSTWFLLQFFKKAEQKQNIQGKRIKKRRSQCHGASLS